MYSRSREAPDVLLLKYVVNRCTTEDVRFFIRLIKHDLRINAGPKSILTALSPGAYEAWQASNDIADLVSRCQRVGLTKAVSVRAALMTPVKPMLAEACKSYQKAVEKVCF